MGKAEDIARRQRSEAQQVVARRDESARAASQQTTNSLFAQIEAEIPRALARLEANGYPDAELRTIHERKLFGRTKSYEIATWTVGYRHGRDHEYESDTLVCAWLCSDGKFYDWYGTQDIRTHAAQCSMDISDLQTMLVYLRQLGA